MDENLYRYCDLVNKFAICDYFISGSEGILENDYYVTINCENQEDVGIWGKNFIFESFRKLHHDVDEEHINELIEKYKNFQDILRDRDIIQQQNDEYEIAKEEDLKKMEEFNEIPDDGGVVRCRIIIFNGNYNLEYETGCDTTIEDVNKFLSNKYKLCIPNPKGRKYIGGLGTVIFLSMSSNKFKEIDVS